jgi:hypothetical protein
MKRYGRIPSETTIRKWAFALQEDPQKWINLAVNPKPDLDEVMVHLHATYNLSDAAMEQVRRIIEEEEEKHRRGEPH